MTQEPHLKPCSYFVVRYVANLLRDEGLNIGVLLHCPEEHYLGCLFADDFRWVRRFVPKADVELLSELQQDFENQIESSEQEQENYLKTLYESLSNTIQLEGPRACLLANPAVEIRDLYTRNVGGGSAKLPSEDTRLRIKQQLTSAFMRAQVWERLEKRIPAEQWTQPGDPFTFDYGYKPNGSIHLIHALSIKRDTQLAKTLVYTFDCVRRREPAGLTAVIEALPGPRDKVALATHSILREGGIRLQPLADIDAFAEAIGRDLRV